MKELGKAVVCLDRLSNDMGLELLIYFAGEVRDTAIRAHQSPTECQLDIGRKRRLEAPGHRSGLCACKLGPPNTTFAHQNGKLGAIIEAK
jgi:hypothetical protein